MVTKTFSQTWEHRAVKHEARQNEVLLRAIWRVWKAHERGKLLERVKGARLVKQAWTLWMQRLREERQREGELTSFQEGMTSVSDILMIH